MYRAFLAVIFTYLSSSMLYATDLSRSWQGHLWIKDYVNFEIEHTDVQVHVYHTPDKTLRVNGRFSNGLQTRDVTFSLAVFAELSGGEVHILQMYERVPATGPGKTNVKWKEDAIKVPGTITSIMAFSGVVSSGVKVSTSIKCKVEDSFCLPKSGKYKKKPGVAFETGMQLVEGRLINLCANARSTEASRDGATLTIRECDPKSGEKSEFNEESLGVHDVNR